MNLKKINVFIVTNMRFFSRTKVNKSFSNLEELRLEAVDEELLDVLQFVDWFDFLNCNNSVSDDFLIKYKSTIDWEEYTVRRKLSEHVVRNVKEFLNWEQVFTYQVFSEEFLYECVKFHPDIKRFILLNYINLSKKMIKFLSE